MIRKGSEIRLNVRPVFVGFIHEYFYEGPCRFGKGDSLTPEYDRIMAQSLYKEFQQEVKANMPEGVNLLDAIYVERTDSWDTKEEMFEKMAQDIENVDLYIFGTGIGRIDILIEFAQRYRKPLIVQPTLYCQPLIASAAISNRDLEVYAFLDWGDVATQLRVLRVRKVLQKTNMLLCTRFNSTNAFSANDSFFNLEDVKNRLGVKFRYINVHELLDQMRFASPEGNHTTPGRVTPNLTQAELDEANRLADELLAGADSPQIEREYLVNSLIAYVTVKKNLDLYDCNAFTVPCPDVCSTRRINEMKFTFCLTHSLLNEEGIPSSCEYDINSALSMMVLTNISGNAPYMGNTSPVVLENGRPRRLDRFDEHDLAGLEDITNLYYTLHSVANRKLKGINEKAGNYNLRHFAYEQGFGAIFRYDFKQDVGQPITMARFSPNMKKMFIARGEIVGGGGYDSDNCNGYVLFRVASQKEFYKKQSYFGNHIPLVYGDYFEELIRLAESLDIEPVCI